MSLDHAWAAGFVDGEGTITLALRHDSRIAPLLAVTNTDVRPLFDLKTMFGGQVNLARSATARHKAAHKWELHTTQAVTAIRLLRPYLRVKQAHADIVLLFDDLCRNVGFRAPVSDAEYTKRLLLVHEIRMLNARGVA